MCWPCGRRLWSPRAFMSGPSCAWARHGAGGRPCRRDNPLHVAALGADPARRVRGLARLFGVLLADSDRRVLGAFRGDALIGVLAYTSGGPCLPSWRQGRSLLPLMWVAGLRLPWLARWLWTWWRADPKEPHSHLGPVAVRPEHQGTGVGLRFHHRGRRASDRHQELVHEPPLSP